MGRSKLDGHDLAASSAARGQGLDNKSKHDSDESEDPPCSKYDGVIHDCVKKLQCEFHGECLFVLSLFWIKFFQYISTGLPRGPDLNKHMYKISRENFFTNKEIRTCVV